MKASLFLVRRPPFQGQAPLELIDTLFVAAAFDVPIRVLFLGEGVWQLVATADDASQGLKTPAKALASLPLYDVEDIFVDAAALRRFDLDPASLALPVTALESAAISRLLADSKLVFND